MNESHQKEILDGLEINSSRFIQQIGSTLFFNGSILIVLSVFIPWLILYTEPVKVHDVISRITLLNMGRFATFIGGLFLGFIALRSLIMKKFLWIFALIACVTSCLSYILNSHLIWSVISKYKAFYIPVTSGFLVSGLGIILVVVGGYLTYLTRDREEEEEKIKPREINIKKKR